MSLLEAVGISLLFAMVFIWGGFYTGWILGAGGNDQEVERRRRAIARLRVLIAVILGGGLIILASEIWWAVRG